MTIVLFIFILVVLILVHEFGHFIVAKISKIRVDEFGIGFPPKVWGYKPKNSETEYTINWLPFGGFVKIFGENPDEESMSGSDSSRSMVYKPKLVQAAVIGAGVVFNWILAWLLLSVGFLIGLPTALDSAPKGANLSNVNLVIVEVLPESPADRAGFIPGDFVVGINAGAKELTEINIDSAREFINSNGTEELTFSYKRGEEIKELVVSPEEGLLEDRRAIGVAFEMGATVSLPIHRALWEGGKLAVGFTETTFYGLAGFFSDIFTGNADFSEIAGPVGIVNIVGSASALGFVHLLILISLISINLSIINLVPFPALDGGRLLFLAIE
ncbi:MAG TPA: hypothetical protein ENI66_02175, partial [Candidatus Yonathbacteria bacterium]|nr:hypothetical protein [Candidatus Yonathbacteria bacterium]